MTIALNASFSELDAVNEMLLAIRERPVASLDAIDVLSEAGQALDLLRKESLALQARGKYFNTSIETLDQDVSNTLPLAVNVISVRSTDQTKNYMAYEGYLYDATNNTSTFTSSVELEIVRFMDFDSIPIEYRFYIAAMAGRKFEQRMRGTPEANQFTQESIVQRRAICMALDSRQNRLNMLDSYRPGSIVDTRNNPFTGLVK